MKRVLMVAFHYPPLAAGSGIQRTLRFVQQLPGLGWEPAVLTVHPRVHPPAPAAQEGGAADGAGAASEAPVHRAFALDAARDLALRGRYLGWTARPDRWASWRAFAVRDGLRLIERWKPDLLWSTYPIATAHAIGAELQRRSGLPWVADFRDPMAQDGYPADPATWRSFQRIEEAALRQAAAAVFTTPGAAQAYRDRYPGANARIEVIENGYDEGSFAAAAALAAREGGGPLAPGRVTLLHSGIVYPSERDPVALFAALQRLLDAGRVRRDGLRIRFRAPVHGALLHGLARRHGVEEVVEILPPVGYAEALAEMLRADGLLLLQAANCNAQIPAKFYEYLRAGRPVLALTDPAGDTAGALRGAGIGTIARLDAPDEIAAALARFLEAMGEGRAPLPQAAAVAQASRQARTRALALLLDRTLAHARARP
jgi:glycosyltransferase involved in cell wall biosynthesis